MLPPKTGGAWRDIPTSGLPLETLDYQPHFSDFDWSAESYQQHAKDASKLNQKLCHVVTTEPGSLLAMKLCCPY